MDRHIIIYIYPAYSYYKNILLSK